MSRDVFEDRDLFERYIAINRHKDGLTSVPEWPHLCSMLPDLNGARVLDLGCGLGWFSRFARAEGALHVHAIDLSANMIDKARSMTSGDGITYMQGDLDDLILPDDQYDVVFSGLTFHFVTDLPRLVGEICKSLKCGGHFVFSVDHPIFSAPTVPNTPQFVVDEATGASLWQIDAYGREGVRMRNIFETKVPKQHRTTATYINILLHFGFRLKNFGEWTPSAEQLERHPEWEVEFVKPTILLIGAVIDL